MSDEEQKKQEVVVDILSLPQRRRGNHSDHFKKIKLITNHYFVKLKPLNIIYIFNIRITPNITYDNVKLRNEIISLLMPEISQQITNPVYTNNNIYSLQKAIQQIKEYSVADGKLGEYKVIVKKVKQYNIKQNEKLLLQFLNNGLRNIMKRLDYVEIGRSGKYFNSKDRIIIDNLFMYSGFKANFHMLQKGYFLRVDSAKKIVRNQTVLQFIDQIYRIHKDKDKTERRTIVKNQLVDKVVMSNYGKTRYYKITDIKFQEMETIKIDSTDKTLVDYYLDKYKIAIKNTKQPLIVVQNKRNQESQTLLIPELMLMTGIPQQFDQMRRKKISEITIMQPKDKVKQISVLMEKLKNDNDIQGLKEIGINLEKKMAEFTGMIIPAPILQLGNKNIVDRGKQAFFNLFSKPIFQSKHDIKLGIIYFKGSDMSSLFNTFDSTSKNLGVNLKTIKFQIDSRPNIIQVEGQMKHSIDKECNICLIVLPNILKNQYKQLKLGSIDKFEIATQMMTQFTLRKKNIQSIATKILLQIIAKRGNTLWVPKTICKVQKMMLVGIDQAKLGNKTLVSICATINSTFSSVFSDSKVFQVLHDKYQLLANLLLLAVAAYVTRNGYCPKQIIIYLNSVPADQVINLLQLFIAPAIKRLTDIYNDSNIALTVIMINTKTSQRFFLQDYDMIKNVPAGTLINQELVSLSYDFFIVSQQSNRGTALPNHYRIIFTNSLLQQVLVNASTTQTGQAQQKFQPFYNMLKNVVLSMLISCKANKFHRVQKANPIIFDIRGWLNDL